MKFHILLLTSVVCLALGCPSEVPFVQLEVESFRFDGAHRSYELYVPDNPDGEALPLVVGLHGLSQSGFGFAVVSELQRVAAREGFIVAYPNGQGRRFNFGQADGPTDVDFILAVVDDVAAHHPVDLERIYLTGTSNGGFMTHRVACDAPGVFAAVAPIIAALPTIVAETCEPDMTLPVLMINGTADTIVPFDGTEGARGYLGRMDYWSVPDTLSFWLNVNGLSGPPQIEMIPDLDPSDGALTTLERYESVDTSVEFYLVDGGGHAWPGTRAPGPYFLLGTKTDDFSATEVIWEFFSRHARS